MPARITDVTGIPLVTVIDFVFRENLTKPSAATARAVKNPRPRSKPRDDTPEIGSHPLAADRLIFLLDRLSFVRGQTLERLAKETGISVDDLVPSMEHLCRETKKDPPFVESRNGRYYRIERRQKTGRAARSS